LSILQFIKIIFSDLSHLIASTVIDLILLVFVKNRNKRKLENARRNTNSNNKNYDAVIVTQQNKNKSVENRITCMIIINGIIWLIFKLPAAFLSFSGFFLDSIHVLVSYLVCKYYKFCESLENIFYFI